MNCSLCLKQTNKCKKFYHQGVQLPCNHVVCFFCLPNQPFKQGAFTYQCETCLSIHQIDLKQQTSIQTNYFRNYSERTYKNYQKDQQGQCVFCWSCYEAITLRQYIKGCHHDHSVETYEQALPQVKNLLINQLQKCSRTKEEFEQNKSKLEKNNLKECYQNLVDKINDFFHSQMEHMNRKRQNMIQEAKYFYNNSLAQIKKNIQALQPLIEGIKQVQNKISEFLSDSLTISEINPISNLMSIIGHYAQNLKINTFFLPQLPQFIPKSTLKDLINQSCSFFVRQNNDKKKYQQIGQIKDRNTLRKNFDDFFSVRQSKGSIINNWRGQLPEQRVQKFERKVKLVQKVKGKLKNCSSMCSTAFA